ncbi:MAG: hypothetical protein U1G07_04315 [Verrucomicrobiota bacterium]
MFDYAAADRSLGILYREAPSWPIGIGNRNKSRAHLEAAVEQKPEYPENHICLAEAYARWGEVQNLDRQLRLLNDLIPRAQKHFAGEQWRASWDDWQTRIRQLQKTRERLFSSPRISPSERGARPNR